MGPLFRLAKAEDGPSADDLPAVVQEKTQHCHHGELQGPSVDKGEVYDTEGGLKLGPPEELPQDHLVVGIPRQFQDNPYSPPVGLVTKVGYAVDGLCLDPLGDSLEKVGLVDHVGDLGDHYRVLPLSALFDVSLAPYGQFSPARAEGVVDTLPSQNNAARREIWPRQY